MNSQMTRTLSSGSASAFASSLRTPQMYWVEMWTSIPSPRQWQTHWCVSIELWFSVCVQ